ncbi:flagellar protein FlaG [Stutzerimonas kunmingensis]|uniref:flagellar protein FlaG n=1 Tax=Stutzerimonas kunmingensis TaxID=1211807 RepID=UPI001CD04E12|nr:flagellar protein FlaG [Stutzerimonas kunmingensis]
METVNLSSLSQPNTVRREMPSLSPNASGETAPTDGAKAKEQSVSASESATSAVERFKSIVQDLQRNLDFSVDDSSGQVVVKVMDGESGKLIRQIPSEDLLRLSERLEDMRSLLFKAEA